MPGLEHIEVIEIVRAGGGGALARVWGSLKRGDSSDLAARMEERAEGAVDTTHNTLGPPGKASGWSEPREGAQPQPQAQQPRAPRALRTQQTPNGHSV